MIKWFKKYMFLKKLGIHHAFKASFDNKHFIYMAWDKNKTEKRT